MAETHYGGTVLIRVKPATGHFREEVMRALQGINDVTVPVDFDPDKRRVEAARRELGRDVLSTVEFKADSSGIIRELKRLDAQTDRTRQGLTGTMGDLEKGFHQASNRAKQLKTILSGIRDANTEWRVPMRTEEQVLENYRDAVQDTADAQKRYLKRMRDDLNAFMKAANRFDPLGNANLSKTNRQVQDFARTIDSTIKYLDSVPGAKIDIGWNRSRYERFKTEYENVFRDIDRLNRENARVSIYVDGADRFSKQLDTLRRNMAFVPQDLEDSIRKAVASLKEAERQVRIDPDANVTVDVRANVDEANRRLKELKDNNRKLQMDVDAQTALASAHLAYLTRPRTIDVFMNVRDTNLGKLFNGITAGATGLKGVENQFNRLVNLFDSLDTKVPAFATLGTIATSVGAGLVNLGSSALGVGSSIVTMSKAALAAPAALSGMAAAGYVGYQMFGDIKERISNTETALTGLNHAIGEAAYAQYGENLFRLIDEIAPAIRKGFTGIAYEEGRMANGLVEVVRRSNDLKQLSTILGNTKAAVRELSPGVQDVAAAFLDLGDSTSKYLPKASAYMSGLAHDWASWVRTASETGQIDASMRRVVEQGGYLKSSIGSLTGIFKGLYSGLGSYQNGIEGISKSLSAANDAINSFKAQETMKAWASGAKQAQANFRASFKGVGDDMYELRSVTSQVFADAGATMGKGLSSISRLLASSKSGIGDFSSGIRDGFDAMFDAIGDSGPAFSSVLTMVGQLSRTFGTTLANSLRTAGPLITALADSATTVARAFNALPAPIQSAIALYATFGRSATSALDALKTGMLTNVQQTLAFRSSLAALGMESRNVNMSMGNMVRMWSNANLGTGFSVVSKGMGDVSSNAEKAGRSMRNVENGVRQLDNGLLLVDSSARKAGGGMGEVSSNASRAGTAMRSSANGVKAASSGIGAFAKSIDLAGLAMSGLVNLGVGAAFVGISAALSSYTSRTAGAKAATDSLKNSMVGLKQSAEDTSSGVKEATNQIKNDTNVGHGGITGWISGLQTGFKSAADNAKQLGISQDDLTKAVTGTSDEYQSMLDKLGTMSVQIDPFTGQLSYQGKVAGDLSTQLTELRKGYEDGADRMLKYMRSGELVTEMQSNLSSKLSDFATSFAANGKTLDTATEGGRRNSALLKDIAANAKNAAAQALVYGKATGTMGEAQQKATNIMYEARQSVIDTLTSYGMTAQAAGRVADSLGLIPKNVTTKFSTNVEERKAQVEAYVNDLKLTEGQKNMVLKLSAQGAITDMESLQQAITDVTKGKYVTVLTADNKQVVMKVDQAKSIAEKAADGTYKTKLDAEDLASPKLQTAISNMQKAKASSGDIQLLLDAKDDASEKIKNVDALAKGLGLTPADINVVANTDNASSKLDGIKAKLRDQGLTDKQINVLLDAIDNMTPKVNRAKLAATGLDGKTITAILNAKGDANLTIDQVKRSLTGLGASAKDVDIIINAQDHSKAEVDSAITNISKLTGLSRESIQFIIDALDNASPKMDTVEKKKTPLPKGVSFTIDATDNASPKVELAGQKVNQLPEFHDTNLDATDNVTPAAGSAQTAIVLIPRQWLSTLLASDGTTQVANTASGAVNAIPANLYTLLTAGGNTPSFASLANTAVIAIPRGWASSLTAGGNTPSFASLANSAVRNVPRGWASSLTAGGNTPSFASLANSAVRNVPRGWASSLTAGGNTPSFAQQAFSAINMVPRSWSSTITASVSGIGMVSNLASMISAIPRFVTSVINVVTNRSGGNATGGLIKGPGTGTSDSIPTMLSNGEYVIKAASVKRLQSVYGANVLDVMNSKAVIPASVGTRSVRASQTMARSMERRIRSDVEGFTVSVDMPKSGMSDLDVDRLIEHVDAIGAMLPQAIAENSSPWPSKRAFQRDARGAVYA